MLHSAVCNIKIQESCVYLPAVLSVPSSCVSNKVRVVGLYGLLLTNLLRFYSEKKEVVEGQQKHFHLVCVLTAAHFAFLLLPCFRLLESDVVQLCTNRLAHNATEFPAIVLHTIRSTEHFCFVVFLSKKGSADLLFLFDVVSFSKALTTQFPQKGEKLF